MIRLGEHADHIAEGNSKAAERWVERLFQKVGRLETLPDSGRMVPEVQRQNIREIIFGAYRIIYRRETERVAILTIRHCRQQWARQELEE
ncbi:MAG: toxin ParE1/3/4 [Rhodothermales bacterium]|jgi:toxin ParE1/3/4